MTSTNPTPFTFPREYTFPPFFTRQTNLDTHHAQLTKWSDLILSYCRHHRIFKLALSSAVPTAAASTAASSTLASSNSIPIYGETEETYAKATSTSSQQPQQQSTEELFYNKTLNKRLSLADAREVIDFMRKEGRAEYVGGSSGGDIVWVYWKTPEEWAALVEAWVEETGQKGVVMTLYELTEGDGSKGTGRFCPALLCDLAPYTSHDVLCSLNSRK